jgi:hypothetical protein
MLVKRDEIFGKFLTFGGANKDTIDVVIFCTRSGPPGVLPLVKVDCQIVGRQGISEQRSNRISV